MGWLERLGVARWLAGLPGVQEAVYANADLTVEDRGWRPAGSALLRDVTLSVHLENIKNSEDAYHVNPIGFRIVELATDYVLGKGMALRAKSEDVQRFIARWWLHPQNRMDVRQFEMMTELALTGELFVTLHTNPLDKLSYLRLIPAPAIDRIEVNPEDLEDERRFHRVAVVSGWDGISWGGDPDTAGKWFDFPDCRHYAINRLVGGIRGQGDLVPLLPWLRRYKDWLTDRVRINKFKGAYLWDVTIKGANKPTIDRRKQEIGEAPASGSVLVHNESEEWKPVQPQIAAESVAEDGRAIRLMVATGAGIPLHFLAEPEGTSRATAAEMLAPTVRHYGRRQLYFGWLMADLARECGRRFGLSEEQVMEIEPEFEDLTARDNLDVATAAETIAGALETAERSGWIDGTEAAELFRKFCSEPLGVGVVRRGSYFDDSGARRPRRRASVLRQDSEKEGGESVEWKANGARS